MASAAWSRKPWSAPFAHVVLFALCLSIVVLVNQRMHTHRSARLHAMNAQRLTPTQQRKNIAIVMSDSRSLAEVDSYHHWSFLANLRYAATHNYELRYYHIIDNPSTVEDKKNKPACHHLTHGWRASPWCKLVALLHALEQGKKRFLNAGVGTGLWSTELRKEAQFRPTFVSFPHHGQHKVSSGWST